MGGLAAFIILKAFRHSFDSRKFGIGIDLSTPRTPAELAAVASLYRLIDRSWRILLSFGCLPAVVALYFRLTIPETPRFTMDVERNVTQV